MLAHPPQNAQAAALVAAAVAARINATLAAKQQQNGTGAAGQGPAAPAAPTSFDADVDINHSKVRHILVKGMTHTQVDSPDPTSY